MAKRKRAIKVFSTLGDVGALLMSFIYIAYISLLLIMSIGVFWLNIAILALTIIYCLFFIFKILYLNNKIKTGRLVKFSFRYAKYFVRLINATIVIISLVSLRETDGSAVLKVVSIAILVVMLSISIALDITMFFVRRKVRELRTEWENLPPDQKHNKLEYLVKRVVLFVDGSGELTKFLHFENHEKKQDDTETIPPENLLTNTQIITETNNTESQ